MFGSEIPGHPDNYRPNNWNNTLFVLTHTKRGITIIFCLVGIGLEYTQGGSIKTKEIDLFDLTSRYMISSVIINLTTYLG